MNLLTKFRRQKNAETNERKAPLWNRPRTSEGSLPLGEGGTGLSP